MAKSNLPEINPTLQIKNIHTSKMGYSFDFNDDKWQLDGSLILPINNLRVMDELFRDGARKTLCRYAEEMSASHVMNMFNHLNQLLDDVNDTKITIENLINWKCILGDKNEYRLGSLRSFLINWHDYGFLGIDKEIVKFLMNIELKGIEKGKAVKNACPFSGPLTSTEMGGLLDWTSNSYSKSELELYEFSCFLILALTGRRISNVRTLKRKDIIIKENGSNPEYIINFPRSKQRNSTFRSEQNPITINNDLYLVVLSQANESIREIENTLGHELPNDLIGEIPVFIEKNRIKSIENIEMLKKLLIEKPDYLHMKLGSMVSVIGSIAKKCPVKSERTGDFIHITSRRFRYTKGTNLSRLGIRGVALAAALDHKNTEHIGVYSQNTEDTAELITKIMATTLAPLAQAFAGTLVASERDAIRGNDPHSRIKNKINNSIGTCGTYAFCTNSYRNCYTCIHFQPWLDAPHEEVLNEIFEERERQKNNGISSQVIQSTDRLVLAVQQVINMCNHIKDQQRLSKNE